VFKEGNSILRCIKLDNLSIFEPHNDSSFATLPLHIMFHCLRTNKLYSC